MIFTALFLFRMVIEDRCYFINELLDWRENFLCFRSL